MAFCGKCGAPLKEEKFCPNCGEFVQGEEKGVTFSKTPRKRKGWKKVVMGSVIIMVTLFIISKFIVLVDEPCDWCGNTPSVAYKVSDGSDSYVCKECSKVCAWCGNKATNHYENMMGIMVFVCEDCNRDITEE